VFQSLPEELPFEKRFDRTLAAVAKPPSELLSLGILVRYWGRMSQTSFHDKSAIKRVRSVQNVFKKHMVPELLNGGTLSTEKSDKYAFAITARERSSPLSARPCLKVL